MIIEQLIERGDHIYIIIYKYISKIYLNKHVYIYTGICTSQKFANFANFPGFKIQDSRFWGKLLESRPGLGFKKFSPEYPKKIANSANFPGSINLEPNGISNGILMILTW